MKSLLPVLLICVFASCAKAADVKLNVLHIVVDDLKAELGCYGADGALTPNIDRLARRGITFDHAYCQFPLCSPSRTSFLTGKRPETSGVVQQDIVLRDVKPDALTLPQFFKDRGWLSAGAGKVFHHNDAASWMEFDESKSGTPQEDAATKDRSKRRKQGEAGAEWTVLDASDADTSDGKVARVVAEQMTRAVKEGRPFYCGAGFRKPHLPWTAPKRYFDQHLAAKISLPAEPGLVDVPRIALITDITGAPAPSSRAEAVAAYRACVSFMDAQAGVLLDTLDRLKLWDSTVVVFHSDHGFHLGDHEGLWAKLTNFEQCAQVPLIVAVPGTKHAGERCPALVELIDLFPTLIDVASLPIPPSLEGRSLKPLLVDPGAPWDHPAYTCTVHEGRLGRSVRTIQWRYTEWDDGDAGVELYDQVRDPLNYRNLADDSTSSAQLGELRKLLRSIPKLQGTVPEDAQSASHKKKSGNKP